MKSASLLCLASAVLLAVIASAPVCAYDTFGNGFGSKWGADPNFGTGAVVTWGYMLDSTPLDPTGFPYYSDFTGSSNITAIRNSVDANYGAGAFDAAIQNAFNTWSSVANIKFVGPITDSGLAVGSASAITPHIRIGAFQPIAGGDWDGFSAMGFGPPGPSGPNDFPLSGDVIFNVNGVGTERPYQIAPGTEDVDGVDVFRYGDDLEGLFLHELGHAAIGLEHPRWVNENPDQRVMYVNLDNDPATPDCCQSINRKLHADDIAAAQNVYGLRGDFNRNGKVDAADYVLWRDTKGSSVTVGTAADGNIDGMVDDLDYAVWRAHFGDVRLAGFGEQPPFWAGTGGSVPEPSTIAAVTLAAVVLSAASRRRPVF